MLCCSAAAAVICDHLTCSLLPAYEFCIQAQELCSAPVGNMDEPSTSYDVDDRSSPLPGFNPDGTMQPDHPLLQRAQQALSRQLEARRYALQGELREKQNALQVLFE